MINIVDNKTPKKRGRPPKNKTTTKQTKSKQTNTKTKTTKPPNTQQNTNDYIFSELCSLTDWITSYGSDSSLQDISLSDLYSYLRSPYINIKNIRNASKYLSYKHGILRDVCNLFKYLPTLNYHLSWSSFDNPQKIKKYEKKVYDFLETIKVKELVRDGLYETCELGTIVTCLRKQKYVQFLDLDDLRINRMKNGKWIVEYDLDKVKQPGLTTIDIKQLIEELPEEVTLAKYNRYRNKGQDYRFVELKNCDVIPINSVRNFPFGFPYSMGAWASLIQKEIINKVERSVSDRLIKQLLILSVGTIGGDKNNPGKPVPKDVITSYFDNLKNLLIKKQENTTSVDSGDTSGIGLATLPDFFKLENVKTDVTIFTKDLYDKINNDIFLNLGVSSTLLGGSMGGANYSGSQVNADKLFRYIFGILEQFEYAINSYISTFLPKDLDCKFYFERSTFINRDKMLDKYKELYNYTGIVVPWLEGLTGVPYHYIIGQKSYQDKVLGLDNILNPPQNPFNQPTNSGNPGRPEVDSGNNSETDRSKASGKNELPSPSD